MCEYLQETVENVTVTWIEEEEISVIDEMLPPSVRPVTGISSTHQILSFAPGEIFYRALSCFCKYPDMCACHKPTHLQFDSNSPAEVLCSQSSDSHAEVPPPQSSKSSLITQAEADFTEKDDDDNEKYTEGQFVIVKYEERSYCMWVR